MKSAVGWCLVRMGSQFCSYLYVICRKYIFDFCVFILELHLNQQNVVLMMMMMSLYRRMAEKRDKMGEKERELLVIVLYINHLHKIILIKQKLLIKGHFILLHFICSYKWSKIRAPTIYDHIISNILGLCRVFYSIFFYVHLVHLFVIKEICIWSFCWMGKSESNDFCDVCAFRKKKETVKIQTK